MMRTATRRARPRLALGAALGAAAGALITSGSIPSGAAADAALSSGAGTCPVTRPHEDQSRIHTFDYGNDALAVNLWQNGVLRAGPLPDGGSYAEIRPQGSIVAKLGWWRVVDGRLGIEGERLDAPAAPLRARIPDGYGSRGFQATQLTFPTAGCWRVVGRVSGRRLTFVVRVIDPSHSTPAPSAMAWRDAWTRLRRPLHLPRLRPGAGCPVSTVDPHVDWEHANIFGGSGVDPGPVYLGLGDSNGVLRATHDRRSGDPWAEAKVFWYVSPGYRGPVLVRGRRLDGGQTLAFDGDGRQHRELRIEPSQTVAWEGQPRGSRGVPTGARVRAPGCYGVQVDGTRFSRVVVFRATVR